MSAGSILGVVIGILLYALAIWIVSKFGLGLHVSGFRPALIAATVIAVVGALIIWVGSALGFSLGGSLGAIIHLIIAAIVVMFAGNSVKGLRVKGFVGALIAAVAIAVVSWLIDWGIGLVGSLF